MASDRGNLPLAVEHFVKGLHHARILGNRVIGSACLEWLGIVGLQHHHWRELVEIAGFTDVYRAAPATADPLDDLNQALAQCHANLSSDVFQEARRAGARLSLDEAVALARRTATI